MVYPIETVTSEDGGEYDCIVTVGSEQNSEQRLQSDTIRASLTVYYGKSCKVMAMCYISVCIIMVSICTWMCTVLSQTRRI